MRALVVAAALVFAPAASRAASPEENYVAARNVHIKALTESRRRGVSDRELSAQHSRALADLERQVRRLVGRTDLKGMAAQGRINLEGLLQGDQDFGMLDGLVFRSKDDKTRVVVTTQNLLKSWLRDNRDAPGRGATMPQGMAPALRFAPFYTRALGGGAAFGGFAELPVGTDAGYATALLVARAQDIGPRNPDELVVAAIKGQRVFIVSTPAAAAIAPMPDCEAIWPALKSKSDAAHEAYRASGMKDKSILDRLHKAEDDADATYMRCFAERAPRDPNFKKLAAQAQAIVDALPAR